MKLDRLEAMTGGWFVGDFSPTAARTADCEMALKRYAAGAFEAEHFHKISTEITLIVSGRARMCGREVSDGDIVTLEPNEATSFEALTDVVTAVVKLPSSKDDKYLVSEHGRPGDAALRD